MAEYVPGSLVKSSDSFPSYIKRPGGVGLIRTSALEPLDPADAEAFDRADPEEEAWVWPDVEDNWTHCSHDDCGGSAVRRGKCLRHLGARDRKWALQAALKSHVLDARGVELDAALLSDVLPTLGAFEEEDVVMFQRAVFRAADFSGSRCAGRLVFDGARFEAVATFDRAVLASVSFAQVLFSDEASFNEAAFVGSSSFDGAHFSKDVSFAVTSFSDEELFANVGCMGNFILHSARFPNTTQLGPVGVMKIFALRSCVFEKDITIEGTAVGMNASDSRFEQSVRFRLAWTAIALDRVTFPRLSVITSVNEGQQWPLQDAVLMERMSEWASVLTTVLSLRESNVAQLTLSDVDLRPCRFYRAINLDQLRLQGARLFENRPGPGRRIAVAEEHECRAIGAGLRLFRKRRASRWYPPACRTPESLGGHYIMPHDIETIYRGLRKAFEDSKDAPGASDFYIGEMEMRRLEPAVGRFGDRRILGRIVDPEWWTLTTYWLFAGYGLRAWRSLATLGALILGAAVGLQSVGFDERPPFLDALTFAASTATTGFLRFAEERDFTAAGDVIQIAIRLLGPALLALTLLALRSRVKR